MQNLCGCEGSLLATSKHAELTLTRIEKCLEGFPSVLSSVRSGVFDVPSPEIFCWFRFGFGRLDGGKYVKGAPQSVKCLCEAY